MFRLRPERIDEEIQAWARGQHGVDATVGVVDDIRPGFTIPALLVGTDGPGQPHYGQTTRELFKIVHWLFTGGTGPAEHVGPKPGKPVLLADTYHTPPTGDGRAHLAVHADGGAVLVPCPRVSPKLLFGGPPDTAGEARALLHATAARFVISANLAWPAALALKNLSASATLT